MSKSSELDQIVKRYLLDCVNASDYDGYTRTEPVTTQGKIDFVKRAFQAEYGWAIGRYGEVGAIKEWLQGLPAAIQIDFRNCDILEIAVRWGSISEDASEKEKDKILNNWFNLLANKLNQLFNGYHIPKD